MPKPTRHGRCLLANLASTCLKSRPLFVYRGNSLWLMWQGCNMQTGEPIPRSCKVRIVDDSYFDKHRHHPWGGNQGRALVYLAHWVRTGKMILTVEDWERWCGPPVQLGNDAFLRAVKAHVYGGVAGTLSDIQLPTYCACHQLIKNIEQLERHVESGCWRAV